MTCIVGIVQDGRIYMGGDNQGSDGSNKTSLKNRKVFQNGPFLIGYTSSYRMGQLLQYSFYPPAIKENQDVLDYMTTDFVNSVRECLRSGGYATNDKGEERGGNFLVGYKGRLFEIQNDFSVMESSHAFNSVGCGYPYALGSLITSDDQTPKDRIINALKAAEVFSVGVGKEFDVLELKA